MAGEKEIRNKIASVQNTQKITKAMEMVASSKMRRTQDKMFASRPYTKVVKTIIANLAKGTSIQHPFLEKRDLKKIGILIISTDRGLCGGLNNNLFKLALAEINKFSQDNIKIQLGLIGGKSVAFFNQIKLDVSTQLTGLGDKPNIEELLGSVQSMIDDYKTGDIDALYICYNSFINTMSQKPCIEKILPVTDSLNENGVDISKNVDYIYEPSAELLLDKLLERYLESLVYQSVLENLASEQAARMVAMKAATDNASSLIDELKLVYNKVRQTNITNELNEIVAGAAAI